MSIQGENFVSLKGYISRGTFKEVGQFNTGLFKASLAIPTEEGTRQYIKIAAWGDIAEALNDVNSKLMIKLHGHIEQSSYSGKCRHCNGPEKKYFTEVIIANFTIISDEV